MYTQALESQAGFTSDNSDPYVTISARQWSEFSAQFTCVLVLLQKIAPVWNLQVGLPAFFSMRRLPQC